MASTFTPNKHIEKPANGDDVDVWDVPVNSDWDIIDAAFGGATNINVVGASGTNALTATQYRPGYIVFSGLLTANVNYQLPTGVGGAWTLANITTGAFTVTFSSAGGGTSVLAPRNVFFNVRCEGTNVFTVAASPGANSDITSLLSLGLTGLVKGQGAAAPLIAATPGVDYGAPATAATWSTTQSFAGSTTQTAAAFVNIVEVETVTAAAATGTVNLYASVQSILWYTSNAAANWTINLTFASTPTTLNTVLAANQNIVLVFKAKQGGTPFFNNVVQVDGSTSGVTTVWLNGAPVAGSANGIDVYTYEVVKTGAGTFTVFASLAQWK